jgi:hypothetical protein
MATAARWPVGVALVRIGFRLIGRRQQLRFLTLTAKRMARLTVEQTGLGPVQASGAAGFAGTEPCSGGP